MRLPAGTHAIASRHSCDSRRALMRSRGVIHPVTWRYSCSRVSVFTLSRDCVHLVAMPVTRGCDTGYLRSRVAVLLVVRRQPDNSEAVAPGRAGGLVSSRDTMRVLTRYVSSDCAAPLRWSRGAGHVVAWRQPLGHPLVITPPIYGSRLTRDGAHAACCLLFCPYITAERVFYYDNSGSCRFFPPNRKNFP
jgi:hypothetical protein